MALTSNPAAALFRVKKPDWTAISQRVGDVVLAEGAVSFIKSYLHRFPQLLAECKAWKAATYPGLVAHARHLQDYAEQAIDMFSELSRIPIEMQPGATIEDSVAARITTSLQAFEHSTIALSQEFSQLATDVRAFCTENSLADREIAEYSARFGPSWQSIAEPTGAVHEAVGLVQGAWQALCDDLDHMEVEAITITTAFLLSLDARASLVAWTALRDEAANFVELAKGQDKYMEGSW